MKRLMAVYIALAIICMAVPSGHAQTGSPLTIGQCPPDSKDRVCVDIKGNGEGKAAWILPGSPATGTVLAVGQCLPDSKDPACVDIRGNKESKKALKLP